MSYECTTTELETEEEQLTTERKLDGMVERRKHQPRWRNGGRHYVTSSHYRNDTKTFILSILQYLQFSQIGTRNIQVLPSCRASRNFHSPLCVFERQNSGENQVFIDAVNGYLNQAQLCIPPDLRRQESKSASLVLWVPRQSLREAVGLDTLGVIVQCRSLLPRERNLLSVVVSVTHL